MSEIRFLALCGMLGYGYPRESLERGLQIGAAFVGVDAGSTDPGPYYLGSGASFVSAAQVRRDLEPALCAARERSIPLIIGTAGGSGARPHVDAFLDILRDLASSHGLHCRVAVIPAEVNASVVIQALREGRIRPCGPAPELTEEKVLACSRIVAQMGTGPIARALDQGAEVVVAGRCCDTAIFAAPAVRLGFNVGLALHLAKIAECGALCARPAGANDGLIGTLREDHFVVEPANLQRRCTPESVAAHSLYEQPAPDCFHEPEGEVDMTGCRFDAVGSRAVRVSGSRLVPPARPTVKLEGAALKGFRALTICGIRDPGVIRNLCEIEARVRNAVAGNLPGDGDPGPYTLRFLRYGIDGVMGELEPPSGAEAREVGLVIEAVAASQEMANSLLSLARSTALHQHFAGRKTTAGNLAFPFSPSDFQGGPVYEFLVYHLMEVDNEMDLFPVSMCDAQDARRPTSPP